MGASAPVRVDVRVVAATHRDLIAAVREGRFREDLFYRLNVVRVTLPPLRERGSDILVLAEHFLARLAPATGANAAAPKRLTPDAARALLAHSWPGNVRELRNLMERATVTVRGLTLGRDDLPFENVAAATALTTDENGLERLLELEYPAAIAQLERLLLERALLAAGGNRAEAARRLGIHRQLFYAKMREHGVG